MIFNVPRKEINLSDNEARSENEGAVVTGMSVRNVTPVGRKHKYEDEELGQVPDDNVSHAAKYQRSNSFGSYFVPIVPDIENSVKESQLQFDDLEIVDSTNMSCQQPESVFQFVPVTDTSTSNKMSTHQDESRVSLCSEIKCTSNFGCEHVLSCHSSCDDFNSDPRFFQSQSAPAQLLTDESEHMINTTSITNYVTQSISATNPSTLEATTKSPRKVTSASDFEHKLFDVSSAEKRGLKMREDVNAEEFDNYTTGESSLCDSSRRSLASSRSAQRDTIADTNHGRAYPTDGRGRSKVSTYSGDVYSDHSTRSVHSRSSSHYRGRSNDKSYYRGQNRSHSEGRGKHRTSRSTARSTSRSSSKDIVATHSRRTTHTSYSYTTHHTSYSSSSSSSRHNRVDTSRYTEYVETIRDVSDTRSSRYCSPSYTRRSYSRDRDSSSHRKVSNGYGTYTNDNYHRSAPSGYHSDARSPSPGRSIHHSHTTEVYKSPSSRAAADAATAITSTAPTDPDNFRYYRDLSYRDLPLEWWERTEHCKEAKLRHTDRIDHMCGSRESLVLKTTLWKEDIVLEPNMFPYYTPYGVEHYTLWSVEDLTHEQIVSFVDAWLYRHMPHVRRWQYDDNSGERSIDLFHVHVFIETAPFQYAPREGMLYVPPHATASTLPGSAYSEVVGVVDGDCAGGIIATSVAL